MTKTTIIIIAIMVFWFFIFSVVVAIDGYRQDQEIEELREQIICNTKLESFIATTTEPLTQENNL